MSQKKVAIIGSGISGLSSAFILDKKYDITVFEANDRLGGHSNTVKTKSNDYIDTGFIVFNERNYPNFCKFLNQLNVKSVESDMSFAYFDQQRNYFYSSDFPKGLFSYSPNILSASFYGFIYNILRFNKQALADLNSLDENQSLHDYLIINGFNQKFIAEYVLPMGAAIWSTSYNDIKSFPVKRFISFWKNHCLLQVLNRPKWRTVKGGSREYIKALQNQINLKYELNAKVTRINRYDDHVDIVGAWGNKTFDFVVIATHADQALKILQNPTKNEERLLKEWTYSKNKTLLHTDQSVAPKKETAWASWIYTKSNNNLMTASYYMNRLQNIKSPENYFVSLNYPNKINLSNIEYEAMYEHPVMNIKSMATQSSLQELNKDRTFFCGSYFGNGFHEDGIASAVKVGEKLDCRF